MYILYIYIYICYTYTYICIYICIYTNREKHHMLDSWSKQCSLEVLVMTTELVFVQNLPLHTFSIRLSFFSCCSLTRLVSVA